MTIDNQTAHQNAQANEQAPAVVAEQKEDPQVAAVRAALQQGIKDPAHYAEYLGTTRGRTRDAIVALLNQTLGNGFAMEAMRSWTEGASAPALSKTEQALDASEGKTPDKGGRDQASLKAEVIGMSKTESGRVPEAFDKKSGESAASAAAAPEAAPTPAPPVAEAKQPDVAPVPAPPAPDAKQEVAPPAKNDPEPAAQGPAPAPDSAAAKNAEPAPEVANQPAPPAPVAAGPEAAPKAEDKAAVEQGKEEKPEEKAHGKVKVTASALRVRAEPSLNGAILGKLPRGKEIKVEGHEGAWLKIDWGGKPAFIHSKYTTAVAGNESEEEEQGEGESQQSQEPKQERPKSANKPAEENLNHI